MSRRGWYVYGVVDAGHAAADVGRGSRIVGDGTLAAIVAPVDLAEFDELGERLNDLAWLGEKAQAHEAVLSRATAGGPVVPLRFGAIYRRLGDVVRLLAERRAEFTADLERVNGRVELGVKGLAERSVLEEMLVRERIATPATAPGRAYLERQQVRRDVEAEASALLAEAARNTHERLLERSVAGTVNRPHARELSGRSEQMFLNAAYLVPAGDDGLRDEVATLGRAYAPLGLSFEVTGPWPPYNFVGEDFPVEAVR